MSSDQHLLPGESFAKYKERVLDTKSSTFCGVKWYYATVWLDTGQTTACHHPLPHKIDANEAPTINGDGTQAYDFIDVEDVARCNVCALEAEVTDEFYNVGTGVQTSIKELCDTILDLKDSDLKVTYNPYSEDDARRLVQNRIGCPKKAATDLGFTYHHDLKTGLQRLIDWRKSNLEEI